MRVQGGGWERVWGVYCLDVHDGAFLSRDLTEAVVATHLVKGLVFRVWGSGSRVWGSGCGV